MGRIAPKASFHSDARANTELQSALQQIGTRVVALRTGRAMTQEQLATAAALDPKHIQDIEHGRSNLTVATLLGLAQGLGVSVADLVKDL